MSHALSGPRELLVCDRCGATIGEATAYDGDPPHYCTRCEPFEVWLWEAAETVEALIEKRRRPGWYGYGVDAREIAKLIEMAMRANGVEIR